MHEILCGDAIALLAECEREYQAIYIDPPYELNRSFRYTASPESTGFDDRLRSEQYSEWLAKLVVGCKRILADDGILFLHISAEQSLIPENVLAEHFQRIEKIVWKKAHGKNTVKTKLGAVVDIILMASANIRKFNLVRVPLDETYLTNSYSQRDEVGEYALGALKHDKTRLGNFFQVPHPESDQIYEAPYGWKTSEEGMADLIAADRIHWGRRMLYKKLYRHEVKGRPLSNLWDDIHYITRSEGDQRRYPTQKPLKLLQRIIEISTDEGDWVLDPVAGSGTTGHAAESLGRNCTLIDENPDAVEIIADRLAERVQAPASSSRA